MLGVAAVVLFGTGIASWAVGMWVLLAHGFDISTRFYAVEGIIVGVLGLAIIVVALYALFEF